MNSETTKNGKSVPERDRIEKSSPGTRVSQGAAAEPLQKPRVITNQDEKNNKQAQSETAQENRFTRQTSEESDFHSKKKNKDFIPASGVGFSKPKDKS